MAKKLGLSVVLGLGLTFASLLFAQFMAGPYYMDGSYMISYGLPLSWLVYHSSIGFHQWLTKFVGLVIDCLFWIGLSFTCTYLFFSDGIGRFFSRSKIALGHF